MSADVLSADELREMYREFAVQPITVRRYTGVGTNRPRFDTEVMGHSKDYDTDELVGSIQQGDSRVVILVEDLIAKQFYGAITASEKVIVAGREIAIISPGRRVASDGTLIAYELQCRG